MNSGPLILDRADRLIRHARRHFPRSDRDERHCEWTTELSAILHDPDIRLHSRRPVRVINFAADHYRTVQSVGTESAGSLVDAFAASTLVGFLPAAIIAIIAFTGFVEVEDSAALSSGAVVAIYAAASFAVALRLAFAIFRPRCGARKSLHRISETAKS
ncbi:hypothetical protein [Frankia gtarii]|uniref:hypothetical protein n=1 Tax=Frankia gtarii TaxID=2950102 RepID=UPI0021BE3CF7|nr:hypothetical protein [Frankia gtarii]